MNFTEEQLELEYIELLEGWGYEHSRGGDIGVESYQELILLENLRKAGYHISKNMPATAK